MDVVGTEIGQKMRSAIKAKLTELGCYVDDELPDYVMVMVANKRTRAQMEDDLQLFLGDNTELFVNWLHQVLKKLQEVTIATPIKPLESERSKSKEKKSKDKKSKKADSEKKAKKKEKDKEKSLRKKEKQDKKLHKSKKKHKHNKHEMIRPNVPPLLMNIEKESEPSITDVFAGQILKNHGVIIETSKPDVVEVKPSITETKKPVMPIIDPSTIMSESEISESPSTVTQNPVAIPTGEVREEQIKEINEIEAKIQGLKQKLAEQLDSMSEDEDFLNIRTEAEELMNDFAEDVFQEISQPPPFTPPIQASKQQSQSSSITEEPTKESPKEAPKVQEELPQIELRLPKRPVRERLGAKQSREPEKVREKSTSPERFTPEKEPEFRPQNKSAKSRLGQHADSKRKVSHNEDETPATSKKVTSRVSVLENRPSRSTCASVVRVRPRPRVTPSSSLLLKAMADAHKSLFNIPPKIDSEPPKIKRAMVLPMRRTIDATNIVIQVPGETDRRDPDILSLGDEHDEDKSKSTSEDLDKDEYIPAPITKVITNTEYVPSNRRARTTRMDNDDTLIVETINIHNPTKDKDKDTQFIVTMDGFNPNAFLAKKLMTEGLLDDETIIDKPKTKTDSVLRIKDTEIDSNNEYNNEKITVDMASVDTTQSPEKPQRKRVSDTSEDSDTQVIIKKIDDTKAPRKIEEKKTEPAEKTAISEKRKSLDTDKIEHGEPKAKKRKASPIVFDVAKAVVKEVRERVRERSESVSSDNHVTVATTLNSNKYDSLPPLDKAAAVIAPQPTKPWCRSFPSCRFGSSCAFAHPKCKFATSCTRRGCVYSHPTAAKLPPVLASHVVPAANFKSISATALPSVCKFFPNCVNPACHFYHPKPCRYGKTCLNKIECNFYHNDSPNSAFRYPV